MIAIYIIIMILVAVIIYAGIFLLTNIYEAFVYFKEPELFCAKCGKRVTKKTKKCSKCKTKLK